MELVAITESRSLQWFRASHIEEGENKTTRHPKAPRQIELLFGCNRSYPHSRSSTAAGLQVRLACFIEVSM